VIFIVVIVFLRNIPVSSAQGQKRKRLRRKPLISLYGWKRSQVRVRYDSCCRSKGFLYEDSMADFIFTGNGVTGALSGYA
jgi:hypothetical protein